MRLSVVVPTRNRRDLLQRSIESLEKQSAPRSSFEILVVDDGSNDDTSLMGTGWHDARLRRYVRQNASGASAARNLGLFMASAPLVLFFDDDEEADPDLIAQHIRAHDQYPEVETCILGHTIWSPELLRTHLMHYVVEVGQHLLSYPSIPADTWLGFEHFWTGRISVKRDFLAAHGIFDRRFQRLEDIELGFRLQRAGLRVRYHPEARSARLTTFTFDQFCQHLSRDAAWIAELAKRHEGAVMARYCDLEGALSLWARASVHLEDWLNEARDLDRELAGASLDDARIPLLWESFGRCFAACRASGIARAMGHPVEETRELVSAR